MASPFEKKGIEGDLTERFELILRSLFNPIRRGPVHETRRSHLDPPGAA
jgi:hypothetical protein